MLKQSHRRLNQLTGEYVLVSPQRTQRPWQGRMERPSGEGRPPYDPACYLCPGNQRVGGHVNPAYSETFVFENDFAALSHHNKREPKVDGHPLFSAQAESGICKVVCFSPRHDLSLPEMELEAIDLVLATWTEETRSLGSLDDIQCVQIFENKGELMGCSNPHPHSQIWATQHMPNVTVRELDRQLDYFKAENRPLLLDYLAEETRRAERIVQENDHWVVLVPFWALWPFETLVLPRRPLRTLLDCTQLERLALAEVIKGITTRYDNLFQTSFPYSMGFHQAPFDRGEHPEWVLHLHFYPPLLRSATVRKFMVGFEMLGTPGRDITPEEAARQIRALPERHYKLTP